MSAGDGPVLSGRRAPRLAADEYIGSHVTRLGRFRRTDPLEPRRLPRPVHWVAVLGWALLVEESLRRARRAAREDGSGEAPAAPRRTDPRW